MTPPSSIRPAKPPDKRGIAIVWQKDDRHRNGGSADRHADDPPSAERRATAARESEPIVRTTFADKPDGSANRWYAWQERDTTWSWKGIWSRAADPSGISGSSLVVACRNGVLADPGRPEKGLPYPPNGGTNGYIRASIAAIWGARLPLLASYLRAEPRRSAGLSTMNKCCAQRSDADGSLDGVLRARQTFPRPGIDPRSPPPSRPPVGIERNDATSVHLEVDAPSLDRGLPELAAFPGAPLRPQLISEPSCHPGELRIAGGSCPTITRKRR
jgi:hypothetical protein